MRISKQQAKSFARLGLRHVCRIEPATDAELTLLVESGELNVPALVEAIVVYACASPVIDIGRASWRERLTRLATNSLALQYQLGASHANIGSL